MSTEESKALVRREYEQGVNKKDFDVRDGALASNYLGHFPGVPPIQGSKPSSNLHQASSQTFLTCKQQSRI